MKSIEETKEIMWQLIRQNKTQKAVAKALHVSKQKFNYWLNHANKIPYEQVEAMKKMLGFSQNNNFNDIIANCRNNLDGHKLISERVRAAMEFERKINIRRGRPLNKNKEKCPSRDKLVGRIDEFVAKKFNLGSKNTYRRAKRVVKRGVAELIEAMDKGVISICHADELTRFSNELIHKLMSKDKKAIIDFLQNKKSCNCLFRKEIN